MDGRTDEVVGGRQGRRKDTRQGRRGRGMEEGMETEASDPTPNLTILEECRMSTALHLVEFSSDLPQGAQLSLKINVVGAAYLHLFDQICIILFVLLCGLPGYFSSISFFLSRLS